MKTGDKFIYRNKGFVASEFAKLNGEIVEFIDFDQHTHSPRVRFIKGYCPYGLKAFTTEKNNLKKIINNHPHTDIFK
jgi:hypothetical protein